MDSRLSHFISKSKILIVDDDEINREILGAYLEDKYQIDYAENGEVALNLIRKEQNYSAMLLDIVMPVMDGFMVLEAMQNENINIPVIVLTSEITYEIKCLSLGAWDFIKKPYEQAIVLARVNRIVELFEDQGLISMTSRDRNTDLLSRSFFIQYANRALPSSDNKFDLLVLNINGFSLLREIYGEDFTKKLLRDIAEYLKNQPFFESTLIGRDGTDMFYLLFTSHDDYLSILVNLNKHLNKLYKDLNIRVRAGLYVEIKEDDNIRDIIHNAISAGNSIRNDFTKYVAYYDDALHEKEIFHQELVSDLNRAMENHELKVFVQPKYYILDEKPYIYGGESLIRWIHPKHGFISPGTFIPLFESNGLIEQLDLYVLKETLRIIKNIQKEYGVSLPISCNISRNDIFDPNLKSIITTLVKEANVDPSLLHIEITESAFSEDAKLVNDFVSSLRNDGFIIELDDFGSGYSSLNTLTSLPFDILKLDMGFSRNMLLDEKGEGIVRLIIDFAKHLGVKIVAEGVESQGQVDKFKEFGCDIIQGYFFSKPLNENDLYQLLDKELKK